jgi:hypothetical protein
MQTKIEETRRTNLSDINSFNHSHLLQACRTNELNISLSGA